jgi:hypothetical protein
MDLRTSWIGTDLGPYRLCDGTYDHYAVEQLPALPDRIFDGAFGWLVPDEVRASVGADSLPKALRGQVPAVFATFLDRPELQQAIPSCTDCYWDVSEATIPGPFGNGDRLVRFLADSQTVFCGTCTCCPMEPTRSSPPANGTATRDLHRPSRT